MRRPAESYGDPLRDDPVDAGRYLGAIRRNALLIAAIVGVFTGAVVVASLVAPRSYEASADLVVGADTGTTGTEDAEALRRELATLRTLVTTPDVLRPVSARLRVGISELRDSVTASADAEANILTIAAVAGTARRARDIASEVARSFVRTREAAERRRLQAVIDSLSSRIAKVRRQDTDGAGEQLRALEERRAQLVVAEAAAGTRLEVARKAELPTAATGPHPVRNGVLAIFAALFLGVLLALARDQLRPSLSGEDVAEALDAPILATLPEPQRPGEVPDDATGAYQTLAALIRLASPDRRHRRILVTSAVHGEGRTTVVQGLGDALAQAGERTLIVSADLRNPDLDARSGVVGRPGLEDLLTTDAAEAALLEHAIVARNGSHRQAADVLPSGARGSSGPGLGLQPQALRAVLDRAADHGYAYVLVDAPPVLADVPDATLLASASDQVLVVARPSRLTAKDVVALRERLEQLMAQRLGLAIVEGGGRSRRRSRPVASGDGAVASPQAADP